MDMTQNFVGKFERYPDQTGKRQAEGGLRLRGERKQSRPGEPLVTIITVCWNSAKTIEQTFRSVADQTYKNIEYVVVDGNSTDGTVDLLRRHEDMIDYYVSEPDKGLYYAMNKGIELAQGDYILILNSDDWYVNDAVEALVAATSYSGCDFVSGLERYVNAEEKILNVSPVMNFDYSIYLRASIHHETMLVPRRIYDQIGPYNTDYRIVGDLDLMIRLFEAGITHYKLLKEITFFRQTGVSNTDKGAMNTDRVNLLSKTLPFIDKEEAVFLANRGGWSGFDLLELAEKYSTKTRLVKAVHAYMLDHVERALQGRGLHAHWKPYAKELIEKIKDAQSRCSPRVSVVLAVYNAEDTLRRCIDSVLQQSLQDIELICINDQTPDGSQAIIDDYVRKDKRVVSINNEKNVGLGATRNRGIDLARGEYVFHLDPDDTLPPNALKEIHDLAQRYGSDMTRGAYLHEQFLLGQTNVRKERKGLKENTAHIVNTTLGKSPKFLNNTEGHWSYLYRADFAKRIRYPEDLKMGQDSIFLVNAMVQARSISITDALVYHYRANMGSAMNTFNFRKFIDALEWRIRAWNALRGANHKAVGENLLFRYWNPEFFRSLADTLTPEEKRAFDEKLGFALKRAEYPGRNPPENPEIAEYFRVAVKGVQGRKASPPAPLRVATFTTQDYGGAGTGSMRRVEALRRAGVAAELHVLFKKSTEPFVKAAPPKDMSLKSGDPKALREAWNDAAVLRRKEHPELKAREMFSKTGSLVDFRDMRPVFEQADIVHMHWVSGVFDYAHIDVLADKPVAWTLADMNAFTGGCHYSEGCENYRNNCQDCPLLAPGSTLAHETWKLKKAAYAKLKNLHIICPSQWLADCARKSSLFGDRPIHVIPNAMPVDRFKPTNRLVARLKLGLPLDKKLVVFGADDLSNLRKGGDILVKAVQLLTKAGKAEGVEALFFGGSGLKCGLPAHHMGHVSDEERMSLIYAAADVFAFPSREDNAPLTVVESMLSGTPVVGFPVGNVPDLVRHKDTGYIARYGEAQDFADGLAWALQDPHSVESVRRGIRCHLAARSHNDPEISVARHLALYEQMRAP